VAPRSRLFVSLSLEQFAAEGAVLRANFSGSKAGLSLI